MLLGFKDVWMLYLIWRLGVLRWFWFGWTFDNVPFFQELRELYAKLDTAETAAKTAEAKDDEAANQLKEAQVRVDQAKMLGWLLAGETFVYLMAVQRGWKYQLLIYLCIGILLESTAEGGLESCI